MANYKPARQIPVLHQPPIRQDSGFQQRLMESKMRAIRAQMNPHFIFNSLNSINAYLLCNHPLEASVYLTQFADLMRQMLDNSMQETITLEAELQFVQGYLQVESMRLAHKLTFEINVEDAVDTSAITVPSMLLQPYLENAIWHGIATKPSDGKIDISIRQKGNLLLLSIEDNGVGRARARELQDKHKQHHESKGLKITAEWLALYDQKHGKRSNVKTIDLFDKKGDAAGTRVDVSIWQSPA